MNRNDYNENEYAKSQIVLDELPNKSTNEIKVNVKYILKDNNKYY
jgi:hypothetical protein